jgi:hypothetical protein
MCLFTPPYIRENGHYGTMSVYTKVMSKHVHNIAFLVTPDVEHSRSLQTPQNRSHGPDKSCAHYHNGLGAT